MNITAIFAYTSYFGGEKANIEVYKILQEAGNDLRLITRHDISEALKSRISQEELKMNKVRWGPDYIGFKNPLLDYLKILFRMVTVSLKLYFLERERVTGVILVPNYLQFCFIWAYLVFSRRPVIFRIGDIPSTTRLHRIMWKYFINPYVTKYVCNSEAAKSVLLENIDTGNHSKVHVIRNIYDCSINSYAKVLAKGEIKCLFVGQLSASKGVHFALEAAIKLCKENKNITFSFVGKQISNEPLIKKLISEIHENEDLICQIFFEGYIEHSKLKQYYEKSHLLIVPSVFEDSSPNVIIEAKHFGLPVVAFRSGGITELLVHKENGYLCNDCSIESLIEGIKWTTLTADRYSALSKNALKIPDILTPKVIKKSWISLVKLVG